MAPKPICSAYKCRSHLGFSLDKLQPLVGQTPTVAEFGSKCANHRPSAFAKQSAYHTIVHHQMSRRKSDTASARETVPPSLILPPAAE